MAEVIGLLFHRGDQELVSDGNPLTVTDPGQNVTRFTYDDLDALKTVQNANNLLTEYSYDQAGNLLAVTQKDGLTLELLSTTSSD